MQTGHILFFLVFPIVLEGCCVGNHQKKRTAFTGPQQDTTHLYYRAVDGESFMMPCFIKSVNRSEWSRIGDGRGGKEGPSFVCGKDFPVIIEHSGNYTCGSKLFLHLQVVEKLSQGCFDPEEHKVELLNSEGGIISCPQYTCSSNTGVRWYKGKRAVSEQRRSSCEENELLHLCQVKDVDHGVFYCDRQIIDQGVTWAFRRAVKVTVILEQCSMQRAHNTTIKNPRIVYPVGNMTQEVELGRPHNLTCEVIFLYERKISAVVKWYVNYGGNKENMTLLLIEKTQKKSVISEDYKVTQTACIQEVTPQHLSYTYTCIATTIAGSSSVTVQLKEKIKVKWPSLDGYTIVSFLLVAGLGIVLHVKWLELQLIYRSHFQHGKHDRDKKEFDVFLSYVWNRSSAEVEGGWTLSSQSRFDTDEEACLSSMDLLNTAECEATQGQLEVLLPRVLEERWGYRLCLPERDMLPGGAYTKDVVLAIQKSHMLICLLSADYLCNSNAVFVLESGVQALLQNSALKLLLIWTSRDSAPLNQQDPQLPTLVQRALKVLPSLNWTSGKPARTTCNFWKSLRKAMPEHRVKPVKQMCQGNSNDGGMSNHSVPFSNGGKK
ncbi:interleukin-18 receptor accessory protein-like isoform X2 [Toxotes jaculatrix]|uniref:interleukin-18 receptor accessory protein-like isoform X2 n=1 Tax=Toxotes jaculatrix TaxID=941984 RepID=UPI001B3B1694|nr:interleukin-18 receptor accessory protein-like isoform X2 [Toxotes jaculatrix]